MAACVASYSHKAVAILDVGWCGRSGGAERMATIRLSNGPVSSPAGVGEAGAIAAMYSAPPSRLVDMITRKYRNQALGEVGEATRPCVFCLASNLIETGCC